jgi:hypothetical protein
MNKKILFIGVIVLGFAFTSLNAQTWSHLKRLTWNSGHSLDVNITTSAGNTLHLVWQDASTVSSIYEIFYKRSTDGGSNWSSTRRLTWTNSQSFNPAIAADSVNNIYIVWIQYISPSFEIYFKKSTNGGNTWTGNKRLTWSSGSKDDPRIATDSTSNIYVVFSPGLDIYFKKSTDGGTSWISKRLSWSAGISVNPKIVVDSNDDIHLVWNDNSPGNYELFYKKSTNGGNGWTATKRLTWTSGKSDDPDLSVDANGVLHATWQDEIPGVEAIYYKKSTNSGSSWIGTKRLTWGSDDSSVPAITSDSVNNTHVIWRKEISGKWYCFYRRANASGFWGSTTRLTWHSNHIIYPDIAVDSTYKIHAVWADNKPGNDEIYYKRGIQ